MIRVLIFATLVLLVKPSFTQSTIKPSAYPDKDVIVYKNAIMLGDFSTAIYALHGIIAGNPNGAPYRDTLAIVYLQSGKYQQAQALTEILYQEKSNEARAEILAICARALNQPTTAIDFYKRLFTTTKRINFGFEQLALEYQIKRLEEARLTGEILLQSISNDDKTKITVSKGINNEVQEVSLKAGVYYILANVYAELNDKLSAKKNAEFALALNPNYALAQVLLQSLNEESIPVKSKSKK